VRLALVAVPVAILATGVVATNPRLTGRTDMWPGMLDLWSTSPVLGVGQSGFNEGIATGSLDVWVVHAHNLWLDAGVRFGVIGLLLVVVVTALALISTWRGARLGQSVGLALVAAVAVAGLTDVSITWRYLTASTSALLLAVLMGRSDRAT
jgi:O-antigen ligase